MSDLDKQDIILVVDDSPDSLSLISDALEAAGISVLVALDGQQAITISQRLRPDMILMDAVMPKMDGFEACRQLKANPELADIPVIFMTGLSDTENIVQGLEAGGVDYLTKPIQPAELLARMRVHLSNARLTHSVHSALDSTGQFLLTVNPKGHVLWMTPQVRQLLAQRNNNVSLVTHVDTPLSAYLSAQLQHWLNTKPDAQQTITLTENDTPLTFVFIEQRDGGEVLLKINQNAGLSKPELFQLKLSLTLREAEVLHWIACGKTNREIGLILDISPRTVNKHLEQVFQKIGVENRTAAAAIALRTMSDAQ